MLLTLILCSQTSRGSIREFWDMERDECSGQLAVKSSGDGSFSAPLYCRRHVDSDALGCVCCYDQ